MPDTPHAPFGATGLDVPRIMFGTSCLGNLYRALPDRTKHDIVRAWFAHVSAPVVADTAGKYGAGLALEVMGRELHGLGTAPADIIISNKLGWLRVPLKGPEPQFEPGAWAGLQHDAVQEISEAGILRCWEQGCGLLGGRYTPRLVSVHDPDEYLAAAGDPDDRKRRWDDLLGAYAVLARLRREGHVAGVGIGAKDWTVIRDVAVAVPLDWVMIANSMTILRHPPELARFMQSLASCRVGIVNSAVFQAGFLAGGRYFDYQAIEPDTPEHRALFDWRDRFLAVCREHQVEPAHACIQFALSAPGVQSLSLNTGNPAHVGQNVVMVHTPLPRPFWEELRHAALINPSFELRAADDH